MSVADDRTILTEYLRRVLMEREPPRHLHLVVEIDLREPGPERQLADDELEARFVEIARSFGEELGITRAAWVEFGVDPAVLDRAHIR